MITIKLPLRRMEGEINSTVVELYDHGYTSIASTLQQLAFERGLIE